MVKTKKMIKNITLIIGFYLTIMSFTLNIELLELLEYFIDQLNQLLTSTCMYNSFAYFNLNQNVCLLQEYNIICL